MRLLIAFLLTTCVAAAQSIVLPGNGGTIVFSWEDHAGRSRPGGESPTAPPPVRETFKEEEPVPEPPKEKMLRYDDEPEKNDKLLRYDDENVVDIYLAPFPCPPCERLKQAINRGELYGARLRYWVGTGNLTASEVRRMPGYPHVRIRGQPVAADTRTIRRVLGLDTSPGKQIRPATNRSWLPDRVQDQWGTYDPRTYRGCGSPNCAMCNTRRAVQMRYLQTSYGDPALPAGQQPTSFEVVNDMVGLLGLKRDDVLVDLGCGDGRILIAAVESSGCKAVGVEIDAQRAEVARRKVREAGLGDSITIVTGDARTFDLRSCGATVLTAYLFPELLAELAPKFSQVRVAATPFHPVPGLRMTRHGDVWLYRPSQYALSGVVGPPIYTAP